MVATRRQTPPPAITPYLTAQDILDLGQKVREAHRAANEIDYAFTAQKAATNYANAAARKQGTADAYRDEWEMASRGLGRSSIRDASQNAIAATRDDRVRANDDALSLQTADGIEKSAQINSDLALYNATLAAKAAENGATIIPTLDPVTGAIVMPAADPAQAAAATRAPTGRAPVSQDRMGRKMIEPTGMVVGPKRQMPLDGPAHVMAQQAANARRANAAGKNIKGRAPLRSATPAPGRAR